MNLKAWYWSTLGFLSPKTQTWRALNDAELGCCAIKCHLSSRWFGLGLSGSKGSYSLVQKRRLLRSFGVWFFPVNPGVWDFMHGIRQCSSQGGPVLSRLGRKSHIVSHRCWSLMCSSDTEPHFVGWAGEIPGNGTCRRVLLTWKNMAKQCKTFGIGTRTLVASHHTWGQK